MLSSLLDYSAGPLDMASNPLGTSALGLLAAAMTARAMHAHLLNIAAARRLRALERCEAQRPADAEFWKAAAPQAIAKAGALRRYALSALP